MADHECFIGMLHKSWYSDLTTVSELKQHIKERIILNRSMDLFGIEHCLWLLKDYADKRKRTNLFRFDYCPECGKRIDWAAIRRDEDG